MKKHLAITLLFLTVVPYLTVAQKGITKEEKQRAIQVLENAREELLEATNDLSPEQLTFKPDENSWSIADCVEHLAISEGMMTSMVEKSLETPADPTKRSEVAMTDKELYAMITNRSQKIKTSEPFEPSGKYGSFKETVKAYKTGRTETLSWLRKSKDDLRNHYTSLPFGTIDAYQILLFNAGHNMRHIAQIREIMESPGFPKS